ncbi:MAG TPA: glycosyltransferase family 4 protein [Gammaproteobacteria bacterium]
MKVLFITEYFPPEPNAAASRVFERARLWAADGHAVTVITGVPNFPQGRVHAGYRNRWRQEEMLDGIRVVRLKTYIHPNRGRFRRILDQFSLLPGALLAGLRAGRPDVVVATSPTLFAALAACLVAMLRKLPFVLEIGDLGSASIGAVGAVRNRRLLGLVRRLEAFAYRRATRIVVQTRRMQEEIVAAAGTTAGNVAIISNGVDVARFQTVAAGYDERLSTETFVAGYVGTLGMAQGLEVVLEAAGQLRDSDVVFRLIGDGAARPRLEARVAECGIANVRFEGPYPRDSISAAWTAIHLALVSLKDHPTFETVVPSKIFEAMACGVPVLLAAPQGEASALVEKHGVGTVVPPGDAGAIAAAVRRLAASPGLLREQSANARKAILQYDRADQARRYLAVLRTALSET